MQTAKLFNNGRSQAVRLPKEFRFSGDDVISRNTKASSCSLPKESPLDLARGQSIPLFSSDFMNERNQPNQQQRASL